MNHSLASQKALQLFFDNIAEFSTNQFMYHKEDKSFSQEISSLSCEVVDTVKITNPKTTNFRIYSFSKTLYSGSREDREIGGWEYKTDDGLVLTIWND